MTKRQTSIKKETRTLGIDLCNPNPVGVVLRGSNFIDGVIIFPSKRPVNNREISAWITKLRFFPELRLTMIHDPQERLNSIALERVTNLPVIETLSSGQESSRGFALYRKGSSGFQLRSRLPNALIERILSVTSISAGLPEPVRVAHAIALAKILREKGAIFQANK